VKRIFSVIFKRKIQSIEILKSLVKRVKKISMSTKEKSPLIPWKDIAGFRDVLIHQYDSVDPNEVWIVIAEHLPILKREINLLLKL
jgi:uncharacterized protein with HEPN domain